MLSSHLSLGLPLCLFPFIFNFIMQNAVNVFILTKCVGHTYTRAHTRTQTRSRVGILWVGRYMCVEPIHLIGCVHANTSYS